MAWSRKVIFQEIRDIIILAFIGIAMTAAGLTCRNCYDTRREFWIVASFTAILWVLLWKGNSYLSEFATRKISWLERPVEKFFINFAITIAYTFGAMYGVGAIYQIGFGVDMTVGAWYSVIITIIISLFMHGRSFLLNWKQSAVATAKLQKENMAARYESLKNQVNPHFLFNSFNALTNLVYEDQEKAVKFIKQLSEVYRYVLDTREK